MTGIALASTRFPRLDRLLLPAGFQLGRAPGHAAHSARPAGAGRTGAVAQSDRGCPAARRRAWRSSTAGSASAAFAATGGFGRCWRRLLRRDRSGGGANARVRPAVSGASAPAAESVQVTGSIKFDGAETDRQNAETVRLAQLGRLRRGRRGVLGRQHAGARGTAGLGRVSPLRRQQFPRLRLILVPRHPERFERVAQLLDRERPRLAAAQPTWTPARPTPSARILLVDRIGELRAWWGTAADRLCRRQPAAARRAEHDRAGRLRRRRLRLAPPRKIFATWWPCCWRPRRPWSSTTATN